MFARRAQGLGLLPLLRTKQQSALGYILYGLEFQKNATVAWENFREKKVCESFARCYKYVEADEKRRGGGGGGDDDDDDGRRRRRRGGKKFQFQGLHREEEREQEQDGQQTESAL